MEEQIKEFLEACWKIKPMTASMLEKTSIDVEKIVRIKVKDDFAFKSIIRAKSLVIKTAKGTFGKDVTIYIEKI